MIRTSVVPVLGCLSLIIPSLALADEAKAAEGLNETFQAVKLSRGGDLNILVDKQKGTTPTVAILLFPGYPGVLRLQNSGGNITYDIGGNFVVRARRFLNNASNFTVMVDCPVDKWSGCDDAYRSSSQHAQDVSDVIAAVRKNFGAQKVYLLGTSYGTVSTSFLARNLTGKINGAVHSSTFTDPKGVNSHGAVMASFDWTQAKVPQLFVHNKDDPCPVTRYASIQERRKTLPLITVEGSRNAHGEPCEAFSPHGFVGREKVVMNAIGDWISTGKVTPVVGSEAE
jgi:hypothetical protein